MSEEAERWRERFNAAVEDAQAQRNKMQAIRNAWYIEGTYPEYHRQQQDRLMREWPTLWHAIRSVLNDNPPLGE